MNSKGNALFLILIAVALFAALSYAMTQSGRGSGNISREQNQLAASRMLQSAASIANTVDRMRLIGGIPVSQLDFRSSGRTLQDGSAYAYTNSGCATADCRVFDAAGGGATYQSFEDIATVPVGYLDSYIHVGHADVQIFGIQGVGSDLPEVVLRYVAILPSLCVAINRSLGLPDAPNITTVSGSAYYPMSGNVANNLTAGDIIMRGGDIAGKTAFCAQGSYNAQYFYHVVVAQ